MKRVSRKAPASTPLLRPEDFGIGQLFWQVPEAIVVREAESDRIVLWNPAAEALFGYSEAEIIGHRMAQLFPGGLALSSGTQPIERTASRRDGTLIHVGLSLSRVTTPRSHLNYDLAIIRDATARVQAEAELRERAELLDLTHDAIFVLDRSLRIRFWNRAAEAMYGYSRQEAVGQEVAVLLKTRYPEPLEQIVGTLEQHGVWEGELSHTGRDGNTHIVASRWVLKRDAEGRPLEILDTNNDITGRRRFELALEESESRFKAFMDAGPVIAFMRDAEGRYVYTNALHQRLFGSQAWIGTQLEAHFSPEEAALIRRSDRQVLETGRPGQFEEKVARPEGDLTLLVFKFPFESRSGRLLGSVALDITPLKLAQSQLARERAALETANAALRESERFKDQFLSILSHELRTPLNFVVGFTSLLDDEAAGPLNHEQHMYLSKVLRGADHLVVLIDNLLDMTRIAAGRFQIAPSAVEYQALVGQALRTVAGAAAEKRITLAHRVQVPGEVWLDGQRILQVLINLLANAIKFTPEGGKVSVRARVEGEHLICEVADTGIGIAAENLPKLFTRFKQLDMSATREAGGMGLGLALSKAIVEGHGGRIGVRSEPGRGSTFWFELPLRGLEGE